MEVEHGFANAERLAHIAPMFCASFGRWMRRAAGLAAGLTAALAAASAQAAPVDTGHLTAELVAQTKGVAPGQTVWLAVRQKIEKGWHTYWRNPGDAGEPTQLAWTLPSGWKAGEIAWPAPQRLPVGPLMDYGYQGEVLLPVPLTAPPTARPGEQVPIRVQANFLVCAETCVPATASLELSLPVTAGAPPQDGRNGPLIARSLAAVPRAAGLEAAFETRPAGVALAVTGAPLKDADKADAYFYPYASTAIAHARPQAIEQGPEGLTLTLAPGAAFAKGAPQRLDGVLALDGRAYEISAAPGPAPPGASGLGPPAPRRTAGAAALGLLPAAALAFLGGLILNLMPCVFPVLAMKAAALAGHAGEHAAARRQGLAFAAGVIVTFLSLAALLIALKAAGAAVGWGFQLQSPPVVAVLALLMLAVALDLSGVFQVGAGLQGVGQGLASRRGLAGAFFTGALAVVVAAPCTAPLMGPAVGWALTQPAATGLAVFLALATGFALPFVLVAYTPALIARMPRPGPWMSDLKTLLAFPMYGAAAWLAWVLTVQAGAGALALLLGAAVAVGLAAWLAGWSQRRRAAGRSGLALGVSAAALAALALGAALFAPYGSAGAGPTSRSLTAGLAAEAYSPGRLSELRGQGRAVFVDYTAAWCVSCQVNETVALSTRRVAEAFHDHDVAYLRADWTRRDPQIAADLARFGRAGVPLYLVYPAAGGPPEVLPSILTEGTVLKALQGAGRGGAGLQAQAAPSGGA
jgi:thiol:disulfide interchange protein DsbD